MDLLCKCVFAVFLWGFWDVEEVFKNGQCFSLYKKEKNTYQDKPQSEHTASSHSQKVIKRTFDYKQVYKCPPHTIYENKSLGLALGSC